MTKWAAKINGGHLNNMFYLWQSHLQGEQRSWDALDVANLSFTLPVSKERPRNNCSAVRFTKNCTAHYVFRYVNWVPLCLNSCRPWISPPHSSVTPSIRWYLRSYYTAVTRSHVSWYLEPLGLDAPWTERLHHAICHVTSFDWHEKKEAHGKPSPRNQRLW